jgi:hypothetical protein
MITISRCLEGGGMKLRRIETGICTSFSFDSFPVVLHRGQRTIPQTNILLNRAPQDFKGYSTLIISQGDSIAREREISALGYTVSAEEGRES